MLPSHESLRVHEVLGPSCLAQWTHKSNHLIRASLVPQILKDVGLCSEMDRDMFSSCVERIAASGKRLSVAGTSATERHEILDTAAALARYFVANFSSLHAKDFFEGIGALPWVPGTMVRDVNPGL